ncbi:endonuclease III domain-containing protein [Candidatus Methanosphaera massiliense]|jgi:endonuclease-3|uniref:endonuclease III domain-containing protein n=1 Tax=Methanosphaera TaxID=2316 RepID=UPI00238052D1|nr:endonuclease III [Candidatus Methanosphaera massiliense]MDD6286384.1 endonuclease III [Methanobacteriaceae archaeon]MDE4078772.1 endonuclease III [Candidatus Methanosphaera massiliense]MDY2744643.1 endonuclease III [Methanosphaera sp.]
MITEDMKGDFTVEQIEYIVDELEKIFDRRTFEDQSPYEVLVRTILSQRTRDENTDRATANLFEVYPTMEDIAEAPVEEIAKLVRPAGFYNVKAGRIKEVSNILLEEYDGIVPDSIDELIKLPGVGRKTANCVLVFGFQEDAIPVDVHVHRISNRLGLVHTKEPEETEEVLREIVPKNYWLPINDLMVQFGQNICKPINPQHMECPFTDLCELYKSLDEI